MAQALHSVRYKKAEKTSANKNDRIASGEVTRRTATGLTGNPDPERPYTTQENYRAVGTETTPAQAAGINGLLHAATGPSLTGSRNVSPTVANATAALGALGRLTRQRGTGIPTETAGTRGTYSGGTASAAVNGQTGGTSALEAAARALAAKQLGAVGGSYTGTLPGSIPANSTTNRDVWNQVQQMKYNASQWQSASEEERKRLAAENERIASTIPGAYRDDSGVWHYGGGNLFDLEYQAPTVQPAAFSYPTADQNPMLSRSYQEVQDSIEKMRDRPAFSYDPGTDPLYQQYADSYTRGGQRAMTDVLGQLAARTGGLASSYAGAMAQQSYDNYMADLASKVPELYRMAYQMYSDDYDRDRQAMLDRYGMYTDALGQYNTDRSFAYNQYRDAVGDAQWDLERQYSADRDLLSDRNAERSWQHQLEREGIEDQRYEAETAEANRQAAVNQLIELVNSGYIPTQDDLSRTGLTMAQLQALINTARLQQSTMRAWR